MSNTLRVIFLLVIVSFSCSNRQKANASLFDVDSLLSSQVRYLSRHHAGIDKTTSLGDSSSAVKIASMDTTTWRSELEIFNALDLINKPINRNSYDIKNEPDTKSNLSVRTFVIKSSLPEDEKDLPIEYLKVYYQDSLSKIRKIEGQYRESSVMHKTSQILRLEFQPINDTIVLTSYSITGGQKMLMSDSVQYKISTHITL